MVKSCSCCQEGILIKILPDSKSAVNYLDKDMLRIANIVSPKEYDEYVILHSSKYKSIFGEKKAKAKRAKKQLSVVRICYEGNAIHRAYRSVPAKDFGKDHVALTPNSIYELCSSNTLDTQKVTISKGCWWMYYWHNPVSAVRMSFRVGIASILFTVFTFLITLAISLLQNCH